MACLCSWANSCKSVGLVRKCTWNSVCPKARMETLPPEFWCLVLMKSLVLTCHTSEGGGRDEAGLDQCGQALGEWGNQTFTFHVSRTSHSQGMSPGCPQNTFKGLWGQTYVHNNAAMLFALFTHSFTNAECFAVNLNGTSRQADDGSRFENPAVFLWNRTRWRDLQKYKTVLLFALFCCCCCGK